MTERDVTEICLVTLIGYGRYEGKRYTTMARLTKSHVITRAGLRFCRANGKLNGIWGRSGVAGGFRLSPESLEMVRPPN